MARSPRFLLVLLVIAMALGHAGGAKAAGGTYVFDGGNAFEQAQVKGSLAASAFNWSLVPATITIHIERGVVSHARPGNIWLDSDLLDSGRFSWGTVQDEYSHQVDFFLFTPAMRAQLEAALGAKAWCYENPVISSHSAQGCERFTSVLPWAYWQSRDNAYRPTSKTDESAAMAPAKFRSLLAKLIGAPTGSSNR